MFVLVLVSPDQSIIMLLLFVSIRLITKLRLANFKRSLTAILLTVRKWGRDDMTALRAKSHLKTCKWCRKQKKRPRAGKQQQQQTNNQIQSSEPIQNNPELWKRHVTSSWRSYITTASLWFTRDFPDKALTKWPQYC